MDIAGSPDIFQAKMTKLMVALEFVRTYLDDLLCITKASLDDHFDHATIANNVVVTYPDYLQKFEIYTDASFKQLGAVITQGNRPIAFFSRKWAR